MAKSKKEVIPTPTQKKYESTQKYLYFKEVRDGAVIMHDGSLRAVVLVNAMNFALLSEQEQDSKVYAYQEFLNSINFPIQILVQSRVLNIQGYIHDIKEAARFQENQLLKSQMLSYSEYIAYLVETANISTNRYYVIVPYHGDVRQKETFINRIQKKLNPAKETKRGLEEFRKRYAELKDRVNLVVSSLNGIGLQAAPLNTQEIVELLYTTYNPDVSESQILADLDKLDLERA